MTPQQRVNVAGALCALECFLNNLGLSGDHEGEARNLVEHLHTEFGDGSAEPDPMDLHDRLEAIRAAFEGRE